MRGALQRLLSLGRALALGGLLITAVGCAKIEDYPDPASARDVFNTSAKTGAVCSTFAFVILAGAGGGEFIGSSLPFLISGVLSTAAIAGVGGFLGGLVVGEDNLTEAHVKNARRATCAGTIPFGFVSFPAALFGVTQTK
ncbi:MAG: hypothetical protein K0U36_05600 [Alphaproteobacteria bacterium]|nr:hypothetical protein [Alphaproteobacteria bacterium]